MSSREIIMAAAGVPTGPVTGQVAFTTPGGYTWVCPAGVTSVSVVCVGGGSSGNGAIGAAGGGGGLGYKNNIPVTPGQTYNVVVAGDSSSSYYYSSFISASLVRADTAMDRYGAGYLGDGGGNGGLGNTGGGGAGGYSGTGGAGASGVGNGTAGTGGGGGGGGVW